jgi:hypothetical protein
MSQRLLIQGCSSHKVRLGLRFHAINLFNISMAGTA